MIEFVLAFRELDEVVFNIGSAEVGTEPVAPLKPLGLGIATGEGETV
jgi:hypothetical protein